MPARKTDKVQVTCPHCGHRQAESRLAISTNCRNCRQYFNVEKKAPEPARPRTPAKPAADTRRITCFDCGTELEVAVTAESTMCKRCSSYVDLKDYRIDNAVSKNFKTKGTFVIEPKGYVFNTETIAEHAIIRGRFLGQLDVRGSLTLHTGAQIKGHFKTAKLIIPAGECFRWPEPIRAAAMDIAGELAGDIIVSGVALFRGTARFFGNIEATNLLVEEGAVVVGALRLGGTTGRNALRNH
jgi:cytoskeletal protein CcmA (bactofilin family)/DNA-directed RNA polymerase subunit RPC12/RpoP